MPQTTEAAQVRAGLGIPRLFTSPNLDPFETVKWVRRDAVLTAPDGTEKFRQNNIEVPESWSERATAIVAEKYFRVIDGVKEHSVKQMILRISKTIALSGLSQGLFKTTEEAEVFEQELRYMLLHQMFAFNSPVWFNVGVKEQPQASACFIQSVQDTMESITDLARKEVRLFKGGSGTGSNLSPLRSSYEKLRGGGFASGPVSFMEMYDAGAGVTKSGGTTRRAAKMVMLDVNHPDILVQQNGRPGFITCKAVSEKVAHDLFDTGKYTAEFNVPGNVYERVGFQNANNSVRVSDAFMKAVVADQEWQTRAVTSGEVVHTYRAKELFSEISKAAWYCGDPGLQFDTTINDWHTCPASGRINGSNPCSEYMFLDDTACNLGSFNLMKFIGAEGEIFEAVGFAHACGIATTAMEILVDLAGYPSDQIGQNSHDFRPLGLGYANLGALLFVQGIAYDSDAGRDLAATITALMSGAAYAQSARIAQAVGSFPRYEENAEAMLAVMEKHAAAIDQIEDDAGMLDTLRDEAEEQWQLARGLGVQYGFRNSQISVLAPTGTISFLMDCDTTGIEPVLAHVVYKKLVGGGTIRMPNRLVGRSLKHLGYTNGSYNLIIQHLENTGDIIGSPLLEQHLPVFQTAIGENAISPEGHIRMMAAVQPFVSGAISKTVNLPATATEEDVANVYLESWKLGLKAIALFRDGCKLSQPAGTKLDTAGRRVAAEPPPLGWGERKKMPNERDSKTHKMKIGAAEGYLHVGLYPDGTPGEIFITMAQEGSTLRGLMDFAATAFSIGLQHGVPLETFVEKMRHSKFEPAGFTDHPKIRMAESIPDYIARWLEYTFLNKPIVDVPVESETVSPEKLQEAVRTGFNGAPCSRCGNLTVRSGACYVCTSCGTTTGCG